MVCGLAATKRFNACRGAYYCGRQHQRQDWKGHRGHCVATGHLRACVLCGGGTGNWCNHCEDTYQEEMSAPVARGMVMRGRALCNDCEARYGRCNVCTGHGG